MSFAQFIDRTPVGRYGEVIPRDNYNLEEVARLQRQKVGQEAVAQLVVPPAESQEPARAAVVSPVDARVF